MKPRSRKSTLRPLACLAVAAATAMSAQAATVAFSTASSFTTADVLDNPYDAGYTFVTAMNVGDSSAKTFNTLDGHSITFSAGTGAADLGNVNMPAASSSTTGYYNGSGQWNAGIFTGDTGILAFNDILKGNAYHDQPETTQPLTLRLTGLSIGETYAVYLYSVDARAGSAGRDQAYWDGFSSPDFTGNTSGSFSQGSAMVVQGTFTADALYQDIFIQETDGVGFEDTHLSAFTLYTVPEPSSALLLTGAGLLIGFRRNRR